MVGSSLGPGSPDCRGPGRYLWWLTMSQRRRVAGGAVLGSLWMVGLALAPYVLSRVIDDGLAAGNSAQLFGWTGVFLAVEVMNAWLGIMRHRTMTRVRMDARFRTTRAVIRQSVRLGVELHHRVVAGEVVTIGVHDVARIGQTLTVTGPGVGAVVAYGVVAALLMSVSLPLAMVVLLGVPVLLILLRPLLRRLQKAETTYRDHQVGLTARLGDLAGGLRVLLGLGGQDLFADRYRRASRLLRAEGYRVGAVTSWIQAVGVGLPVVFMAAVTWLAARMAAQGSITVGELVAVYGYVAVLVVPVSFFIEGAYDLGRGLVSARRVIGFLGLEPASARDERASAPTAAASLVDPDSGVTVTPGTLTALVSSRSAESVAIVDRLGGFDKSDTTWDGVRLADVATPQVRDRILVADHESDLFAGPLRDVVSGRCHRDDKAINRAVRAAMAEDIVQGLPDGLDSTIDPQGRNLSGGQRQRIRLVRALLADPEILMVIEPTSALDSPTEAAVAARLRLIRSGRTTVVTSTSPLLLEQADTVCYLVDGRVVATGHHRALLTSEPGYHRLVARDDAAEDSAATATDTAP